VARYVYSVLCKRGIVDQSTNLLSLIDVLEGIEAAGPARPIDPATEKPETVALDLDAMLVTVWARSDLAKPEPGIVARIAVLGPDGKRVGGSGEQTLQLDAFENFRTFTTIPKLPVTHDGRYEFAVQIRSGKGWRTVGKVPLTVRVAVRNA
jgi:hypothetical protein